MGFFIKSFNRRWRLVVVKENQSVVAMHANCVIQIVGYVMGYFANGSKPIQPWSLYLCSNGQQILLGSEHFTSDGENTTHLLIQQIESRVQLRSATLINRLKGRDVRASEPLDRQVKVARNEIHTSHPERTVPDCHPQQSRT
jgi:hypothetical protein